MQCFGTPWTLKALHPASSCPTSSAGGYFHHTVAVSYWAHSTGASQRHNRLAPIIPSYSSPQWKIQATLSCALSSSEQSKWHKIAQEICSSWQAAPEPATAAGTSWVPGNSWQGEGNWGQRDQKQVPDHNLHLASEGYLWLKQAFTAPPASWDQRIREQSQVEWPYSAWPQHRTEPSSCAIETFSISQVSKANQKIKVMVTQFLFLSNV